MRHYKTAVFLQVSVAALFLSAAGPTVAQDAGADDETIDEIIVTYRKMGAENLQDIPRILGDRIRPIEGVQSTTSLVTFPD